LDVVYEHPMKPGLGSTAPEVGWSPLFVCVVLVVVITVLCALYVAHVLILNAYSNCMMYLIWWWNLHSVMCLNYAGF